MPARRPKTPSLQPRANRSPRPIEPPPVDDDPLAPRIGEWLRRIALGLLAALIVARPYWPCEGVREEETGLGLAWVFTLLICLSIAVVGRVIGGADRFRVSKADLAVFALIAFVGRSVSRAVALRPAINLAWEWVGVGVAYFLIRNLPRSPRETNALAGIFLATAVAVSAHGLYYNNVVWPAFQEQYRRDPDAFLSKSNIVRGSVEESRLRNRLLYSTETFATFALANSLAGFLVGPAVLGLAIGLEGFRKRDETRPAPLSYYVLATAPYVLILACFLSTKSRSADVGFAVAAVVLLVREAKTIGLRKSALLGLGLVAALGGLIALGAASKRFDWMMIVDSTKSLRYRLEYWRGAWRVIVRLPGVFWRGLGPGQFGTFYLLYRLPESSEEIQDPHNMILEAWAVAGIGAAIALVAAIAFALRDAFGPPIVARAKDRSNQKNAEFSVESTMQAAPAPSERTGWLIACGASGWALAAALAPKDFGPFATGELSLVLWLILAASWGLAIGLGVPLWRRVSVSAAGLGAAGLAVAVNLLAAGGIGFTTVALGLWGMLALAQNARDDRPCGRARIGGGRLSAFVAGTVAAALVGMFVGNVLPFWDAERADERGSVELQRALAAKEPIPTRIAALERAQIAFEEATRDDVYFARPWIELAAVEYLAWTFRGAPAPPQDPVWTNISNDLRDAAAANNRRAPFSLEIPQARIRYANLVLNILGDRAPREYAVLIRDQIRDSTRRLVDIDPTNAGFRARCAFASAEIGRLSEAIYHADKALELDAQTPHDDRKLGGDTRKRLRAILPEWKAAAKGRIMPKKS